MNQVIETILITAIGVSTLWVWWYWKPTSSFKNALRWGQALVGPILYMEVTQIGFNSDALTLSLIGGAPLLAITFAIGFFSFKLGNKSISIEQRSTLELSDEIPTSVYHKASREFETRRDEGLFAKAFTLAEGDEAKAKATYIQIRASEWLNNKTENKKQLNKEKSARLKIRLLMNLFLIPCFIGLYVTFPILTNHFFEENYMVFNIFFIGQLLAITAVNFGVGEVYEVWGDNHNSFAGVAFAYGLGLFGALKFVPKEHVLLTQYFELWVLNFVMFLIALITSKVPSVSKFLSKTFN